MGSDFVLQVPLDREPHTRRLAIPGAALPMSPWSANSTSPQGEPVPIPLGEAGAHLLGLPRDLRHHAAHEPRRQSSGPWPPHGARADGHRALSRLAIPVPLALRRIDRVPPGPVRPAEQLRDFFFHHGLDHASDLLAHEVLQPFPERGDTKLPGPCPATSRRCLLSRAGVSLGGLVTRTVVPADSLLLHRLPVPRISP